MVPVRLEIRQDGGVLGILETVPAGTRPDLLAPVVRAALESWPSASDVLVAPIDPELADTAAFCQAYQIGLDVSANCVIVAGKRAGETRYAACLVLATTRADVNGVVRRQMDVRKASFAPMEDAVRDTAMEYGGITPVGLPADWPILLDPAVVATDYVVIGSGIRGSKLVLPGKSLVTLAGASVIEGLGKSI